MTGKIKGNAVSLCLKMKELRDEVEITETGELRKCEEELRNLEVMVGGALQDIDQWCKNYVETGECFRDYVDVIASLLYTEEDKM